MSHLNHALLNLITLAEHDAARLSSYRRDHHRLTPGQLRHATNLGNGIGMQFAHLARLASEHGAASHAAMWHVEATAFFDAAGIDELAADLADYADELVNPA